MTPLVSLLPAVGSRDDRARARSSAVGSNRDQPLWRTACAACCTVEMTPALLAKVTTVFLSRATREPPETSPRRIGGTFWDIAAHNCNRWKISIYVKHCSQDNVYCRPRQPTSWGEAIYSCKVSGE